MSDPTRLDVKLFELEVVGGVLELILDEVLSPKPKPFAIKLSVLSLKAPVLDGSIWSKRGLFDIVLVNPFIAPLVKPPMAAAFSASFALPP